VLTSTSFAHDIPGRCRIGLPPRRRRSPGEGTPFLSTARGRARPFMGASRGHTFPHGGPSLFRICAWCGRSMGVIAPLDDSNTTHGI
jgi:hypothetical protein